MIWSSSRLGLTPASGFISRFPVGISSHQRTILFSFFLPLHLEMLSSVGRISVVTFVIFLLSQDFIQVHSAGKWLAVWFVIPVFMLIHYSLKKDNSTFYIDCRVLLGWWTSCISNSKLFSLAIIVPFRNGKVNNRASGVSLIPWRKNNYVSVRRIIFTQTEREDDCMNINKIKDEMK